MQDARDLRARTIRELYIQETHIGSVVLHPGEGARAMSKGAGNLEARIREGVLERKGDNRLVFENERKHGDSPS